MTDNKALTRVFQAKHIPRLYGIFAVKHFNSILYQLIVPGVENPAADYLSRLENRL